MSCGIGSPVKIATDNFIPLEFLPASVFGIRHCVGNPTRAAPCHWRAVSGRCSVLDMLNDAYHYPRPCAQRPR
jgi:hypothetical protein